MDATRVPRSLTKRVSLFSNTSGCRVAREGCLLARGKVGKNFPTFALLLPTGPIYVCMVNDPLSFVQYVVPNSVARCEVCKDIYQDKTG